MSEGEGAARAAMQTRAIRKNLMVHILVLELIDRGVELTAF